MNLFFDNIVLGCSPFSILESHALSQRKQGTLLIISADTAVGGVWKNVVVNDLEIEAFPHAVEIKATNDIALLARFFDLNFEEEARESVAFWHKGRRFKVAARFESFCFAISRYFEGRSFSRLRRDLRHVMRRRRYAAPVSGFKSFSDSLGKLISENVTDTQYDQVVEVDCTFSGRIEVRGRQGTYTCNNFYFTRGASNLRLVFNEGSIDLLADRSARVLYIRGESKVLARYNKFLSDQFIDRISHSHDNIWIVQLPFTTDSSSVGLSDAAICAYIVDQGWLVPEAQLLGSIEVGAGSFELSDQAFRDLRSRLPSTMHLIDSKALDGLPDRMRSLAI